MGTKYTNQTKWVQYINIGRFDYKYPIFSSKKPATRVKKKGECFQAYLKKKKKKKNLEEILQIEGVLVKFRLSSAETISRQESKKNK
jgi:hypothetical protein